MPHRHRLYDIEHILNGLFIEVEISFYELLFDDLAHHIFVSYLGRLNFREHILQDVIKDLVVLENELRFRVVNESLQKQELVKQLRLMHDHSVGATELVHDIVRVQFLVTGRLTLLLV